MDKIKKRFLDFEIYEKAEVDTISGSLSAEIDFDIITFSGTIDHNTIINTHNLTTDIDHNQLTSYSINEHRIINDSSTEATDLWSAQKISDEITSASGTTNHAALDNLGYASSGHTGFASTADLITTSGSLQSQIDGKSDTGHIHDDRYYTETELNAGQLDNRYYTEGEVDTISGSLSAEIDSDISTHSSSGDHDGSYYTETELDGGQLDNRYYTETEIDNFDFATSSELTATSGTLQTQIDGKDNYQSWSFAVDGVTKDAITSSDVLDFVGGDNITITRSADDQITISGISGGGSTNHDELNNLDYASSGHTGFVSTADLATTSGSLQDQIDDKSDTGHLHDDRYYTETESDAAHDSLQSQINSLGGDIGWVIKSADYTASIGSKIMLDSSGGPFTITLPTNPSLGNFVSFLDMVGNCGTTNVTITTSGTGGCEEYTTPSGNAVDFSPSGGYTPPTASGADFTFCIDGDGGGGGEKIMGLDENLIINVDNSAFDLIYSTAVWGWRIK